MTAETKTTHHHGNLKEALVRAGIDLLEEDGLDGLTLRKCAARAGVSHAAPAHHFDGLSGLKVAIATEGFRIFSNYLESAAKGIDAPIDRLRAVCRGYLTFGLTHPGLLSVIFGSGLAAQKPDNREGDYAYNILRSVCAPFIPEGQNPQIIEIQVWSLIHGFTLLYLSGEFGCPPPPIEDGPFDQIIALLDRVGTLGA
ncbi:TetR/AcrR family transcriptional regulator [Cognatishimia maritima]|uniref:Transcriptional regulator, TetR family n=1 Tax=Cognatishimia maritima TaxID=870908 RepID=A0A1M5KI43_9RHOB|nr:WHG domain-containing protein [Cognatishimia maritima]SHG52437.1 transcriptional regulator, TetR family [Cognatishimia maritima]